MTCQRIRLLRHSEQVPAAQVDHKKTTFTECRRQVENSQLHANDSTCRRGPSDEPEHKLPLTVLEANLRPIINMIVV
jgi:hypothetical protein